MQYDAYVDRTLLIFQSYNCEVDVDYFKYALFLLFNIENNTRLMNVYLINVRWAIKRAKKKGFWKSINPFQTYVNTDKAIFEQILNNAGTLGL